MKLLKPVWVNHDGQPIFSVDIHPDGTKFATGGQGGDAGRVCLWNFGPVINEELEKKESVPKLLCQMDNHLACVNVVRWSQSGKYLASAGDDETIMIWQISKYLGSSATSIFRGSANVEQWRCIATLRGHSGDILDLNWSPSDEYIASGSVDNNVIVWNARKFPEIVTRLNGHNGFVKGVSWDPIGKYVASQSDDKSVKIWRTKDWKEEKTVSEPFRECGGTTHVLRLNWSPDGQFLVSAHAMNNRGSTAQIIEREGWRAQKDFVGHRKAVACVRFNPNILTEDSNFYTLIALGSRDKSVSVWSTKNRRPTLVIHDLFQSSVLDLTWSKDGYSLLGCSRDGTVAFIQFEPGEIGKTASEEAKMAYFQKLYGKSLQSSSKETLLIEDPEILKVREEQLKKKEQEKLKQQTSSSSNNNNNNNNNSKEQNLNNCSGISIVQNGNNDLHKSGLNLSDINNINKGPTDKQIETRMPNGRKRITPIFIPPPNDCDGAPMPFNASATTFSTTEPDVASLLSSLKSDQRADSNISSTPKQSPEKQEQPEQQKPSQQQQQQVQSTPVISNQQTPKLSGVSPVTPGSILSPIEAPIVSLTDSIQNKTQNTSNGDNNNNETPLSLTSSSSTSKNPSESTEKRPATPNESISPNSSAKKIKLSTTTTVPQSTKTLNNKSADQPTVKQANGPTRPPAVHLIQKLMPNDKKKPNRQNFSNITKTPTSSIQVVRVEDRNEKSSTTTTTSAPRSEVRGSIMLPSLKIDKNSTISVKVLDENGLSKFLSIEIENNISNSSLSIVRVLNQENEKVWEMILSSKICGISACPNLVAVACSDLTLSVFSTTTGRRLHTPITLDSLASKLNCYKHYLLAVTCKASAWLWDFEKHSVVVKNESLQPILSSSTTVVNTGITDSGSPVITISSGKSYVFDLSFGSWSLVSNDNDLLNFFSDYKQMWKPETNSYPLAILQSQNSLIKKSHNVFLSNSNLQKTGTLSFIDQQLSSAFILGSSKEYRHWLITLAQFLTEQGIELRLRELCQFLLGPPFSSSESNWDSSILGNEKHSLLREILAIITTNLKLQRIYTEFKQQLDLISSFSSSSSSFSSFS